MSVKVSVGIMAYNEEKYLPLALDNILKQEFSDYEIVIADNASEDATGEIAQKYAKRYPIIRYIRHSRNIGAIQNYNTLVRESRGKYFVLAGAHDLWSDHYLTKLTNALDDRPDAVLASGLTKWIDEEGRELKDINLPTGVVDTSGNSFYGRFNISLWINQNIMYGMFRLEALRKTRLALEIIHSDGVMLSELVLQGNFIVVPEVTWFRRQNRSFETSEEKISRYYKMLFSKPRRPILPHWQIVWAYFSLIFVTKIKLKQRFGLLIWFPNILLKFSRIMIYDLILFIQ